jgi:hypothetical protein
LTEQAYFSLADLVPKSQKHGGILDLNKLNTAQDSAKILAMHKLLLVEIDALQKKHGQGRYK